ncbi:hypothetical protein DM15PD_04410 [Aristophania vespae]|nr:hypothetical protein DM15PD_04410 [Aristophania vespae]
MKTRLASQTITPLGTILRTLALVSLTIILLSLIRFWSPAGHLVQQIVATGFWQTLYRIFHVNSALGKEQVILFGMVFGCFIIALCAQLIFLALKSHFWTKNSTCHNEPR